ncbi:F0F1 ATP synthase subunit C [Candidatus Cytomitobacter indipagum]|uniref:ATP synthase F(0) sector subunit c n=1 Tax=Candidatus Cytomitobacter indipagum TaxID=2601575 RepID=A0A5C0UFI6_9PROT|nr:F0F1 ATP synthase subunit C [Candidatus Cytomitobacter indipagum]QEK38022.1 F0F1 ATP synthase subunit C [Candidatus Cytomitobacter indipagum]
MFYTYTNMMDKMFAASVALLPLIGVSIGLSKLFSSLFSAISNNPVAKDSMSTLAFVGAGLLESIALLSFIIAILIVSS